MDEAARLLLAQGMALAALIGATIEYAEILGRRRIDRERRDLALAEEVGLRALVRVTLVDER